MRRLPHSIRHRTGTAAGARGVSACTGGLQVAHEPEPRVVITMVSPLFASSSSPPVHVFGRKQHGTWKPSPPPWGRFAGSPSPPPDHHHHHGAAAASAAVPPAAWLSLVSVAHPRRG